MPKELLVFFRCILIAAVVGILVFVLACVLHNDKKDSLDSVEQLEPYLVLEDKLLTINISTIDKFEDIEYLSITVEKDSEGKYRLDWMVIDGYKKEKKLITR